MRVNSNQNICVCVCLVLDRPTYKLCSDISNSSTSFAHKTFPTAVSRWKSFWDESKPLELHLLSRITGRSVGRQRSLCVLSITEGGQVGTEVSVRKKKSIFVVKRIRSAELRTHTFYIGNDMRGLSCVSIVTRSGVLPKVRRLTSMQALW